LPIRYFFFKKNEEVVSPQHLCNISSHLHLKNKVKNLAQLDGLHKICEETTSSFFLKKISNFENKGFGVRFIFNPKTAFTLKIQK
jgi:hypothetical protein